MSQNWIEFWDRPNSVYVGERHLVAHFRVVADALIGLRDGRAGLRVLDYGCGEALDAARVASGAARLALCDSSPNLRARLSMRFAGIANIEVLAPESLVDVPEASFDLVFASSVVQYLDAATLDVLLATFRRLLAPAGVLVVADVIPNGARLVDDLRALLAFARQHGFVLRALASLVATLFSDYRRLRTRHGLATYDDATFLAILARAGFAAQAAPHNFGENPYRRSFVARKAA